MGGFAVLATFIEVSLRAQVVQPKDHRDRVLEQQNALQPLLLQVDKFQKTTGKAPVYYKQGGFEMLWRDFQGLRRSFAAFKGLLTERQRYEGSSDLAALEAGLDDMQDALECSKEGSATGTAAANAFKRMCASLAGSARRWGRQLQADWSRLQSCP